MYQSEILELQIPTHKSQSKRKHQSEKGDSLTFTLTMYFINRNSNNRTGLVQG